VIALNLLKVAASLSKKTGDSTHQLNSRLDVGFFVSEIQTSRCQQLESWRFAAKRTASEVIAALLLRLNSF
jgi:hypothetical protein